MAGSGGFYYVFVLGFLLLLGGFLGWERSSLIGGVFYESLRVVFSGGWCVV